MRYLSRLGPSVALAALAACTAENRTREPVVSTADGKSSMSDAGTAVAKRGKSLVRLINAMPGVRRIDLTGDDRTIFYDVAYKGVTPYTEIGDNVVKFRLRDGGSDSVWADNTETLVDGSRYTVVALPNQNDGARLVVFTDEVVPDQGKSRLRVVHAAPLLTDVDVKIEGQKDLVFDDLAFGAGAGFEDVEPTSAVILVQRGDPPATALRVPRVRMEAGKAYTVVIAGTQADGLEAILVTDAIRTYAVR